MFGLNFDLGAEIREVYGTATYEVFCNRCSDPIGTMTFEGIREAIWNTIGRGGVLCPKCRSVSCKVCGASPADKAFILDVEGVREEYSLCSLCASMASFAPWYKYIVTETH